MFSNIYQSLKSGFNQSWFKFLFVKTELGKLLAKNEDPSPSNFFVTYISSWWWNRLWFRSCIQNKDFFNKFNAIISSLQTLEKADILTVDNCNLVAKHVRPRDLDSALYELQKAGMLTKDNFDLVVSDNKPFSSTIALFTLQEAGMLTKNNFDLFRNHADTFFLSDVLYYLKRAGMLTQPNFDLVRKHAEPNSFACALCSLQEVGVLTEDNFALIRKHAKPDCLTFALHELHIAGMLTQANFDLVIRHNDPSYLPDVIYILKRARLLTQVNFETLLAPNHAPLISNTSYRLIWAPIPNHLLTQVNFQRLLTAAEHRNPMTEIPHVVAQILEEIQPVTRADHAVAFNNRQSTHTASVHASVSASALKLMQTYGHNLNLKATIKKIKDYVNGLADDSPRNQAAKRCIKRITAADYTFIDNTSGVSTRQLLALAYTAIHDDSKCSANLYDAKALFIEGLYEIQRGYNLNHVGDDQGGPDASICDAGTFNKLMEKLYGIHSDVEVYYITHLGALSKFPILAKAHATTYLQSLATPETAESYLRIKDLLNNLKTNKSLEPIWEHIKAGVQEKLWDEFQDAYNNNRYDSRFLELINYYQDIEIPNLSAIEAMLFTTPGYKAYLEEQTLLSLEKHSLWANRNLNQEAQKKFDEQYGLVLWRK